MATAAGSSLSDCIEIECSDQPLDVSFHPTQSNLFAAALVDGTVEVHDYKELTCNSRQRQFATNSGDDEDDEIDTIVSSTSVHTQLIPSKTSEDGCKQASCRAVLFSSTTPTTLYTGGSAGDLFALDAERLCTLSSTQSSFKNCTLWSIPDASKSPIHVLYELSSPISGTIPLLVTGDETGGVRLWDSRLCGTHTTTASASSSSVGSSINNPVGCVMSWKKHTDYISGFDQSPLDQDKLLACSADGRLSVYDLRMASTLSLNQKDRCVQLSDEQDDEMLSVKVIKHGKKVICGTADGVLNVWSYGTWGDISDRFPGHPKSIDALLKWDEDTLLTGSSDGMIRVVTIHPDKLIGILGDNHDGYPIEKLQFNSDRTYVGSVTHDSIVRLWETKILNNDDDDENDDDGENRKPKHQVAKTALAATLKSIPNTSAVDRDSDDEWNDMDDADNDDNDDIDMEDDDDDDDDSQDGNKPPGKNDRLASRFKTDNERFFEDL